MALKLRAFAALVFLASCATSGAPVPAHEGGYDVVRTMLTLSPELETRDIGALQVTQIRVERPLSQFHFDANALKIDEASVDGVAVTWQSNASGVVLTLPRAYRVGETLELRIHYHGAPARGLVFADGAFYTVYFSCDWMFCTLDRPGDKFQFHAASITNGTITAYTSEWNGEYPAYLQGFGGGSLTEAHEQAGDVDLVYASSVASETDLRALFAPTPQMLAFFQRRAGVAFPHRTFRQLLVRGDEAQEGAGFSILGEDVVRPILENPHEDWAIAHELAHTYWGNLVTCRDWSQFWLNEGMTTFMVAAWKQERWGEVDYQREIELARTRWGRARDAGWDRPLAFAGPYPDLRTRRAIQYSKGMLFIVELRNFLGEDAFWRGIAAYTRAHAGGVVESADLQRALEAESGRDLQPLFDEWVYP